MGKFPQERVLRFLISTSKRAFKTLDSVRKLKDFLQTPEGYQCVTTVSQKWIQPILRITKNVIVAILLRYSYVQEYVTV